MTNHLIERLLASKRYRSIQQNDYWADIPSAFSMDLWE